MTKANALPGLDWWIVARHARARLDGLIACRVLRGWLGHGTHVHVVSIESHETEY